MSNEAATNNITNKQVLFLGPFSSFSHAAATAVFPKEAELHPVADFPSIFRALQNDRQALESCSTPALRYDYAVVPVRNSTNGPVIPVVELLQRSSDGKILQQLSDLGLPSLETVQTCSTTTSADYGQPETASIPSSSSHAGANETYPDLVLAPPYKYALSVHHHLYVHPGCPIANLNSDHGIISSTRISSLHTHPQVWTQCTRFLNQHFPSSTNDNNIPLSLGPASHVLPSRSHRSVSGSDRSNDNDNDNITKRFSHASTSDAAAYIASNSPSVIHQDSHQRITGNWPAVICSTLAGTAYNLKCIASSIEDDREGNQTTFIILTNKHNHTHERP